LGIGLFINVLALGFFGFNEFQHRPMPGGPQLKEVISHELQFNENSGRFTLGTSKITNINRPKLEKRLPMLKKLITNLKIKIRKPCNN